MSKLKNIPENCEFPQLREIAEEKQLAEKLQQHLGPAFASSELQVESCKIDELNYKPGGACRIILTARIRRPNADESDQQVYFGRLLQPRNAQRLPALLDQKNLTPPRFGPPVLYIPEWSFILWAYPNDPRLPGLALMANSERMLARAQTAPEKFGLTQPPLALTAEMTKYVSGKRCGYLYHVQPPPHSGASNGDASSFAVYGKAYGNGEGEKAYALMKQIWRSQACQRGDFFLPQPYSYDAENEIVWQEAFSGESFAKIAGTIPNLPEMAQEIGRRLAGFHNASLPLPQVMTFDFQVEETRRNLRAIEEAFPDYREDCAALGQKLMNAAAQIGPGPVTPLHASFKFSHIFAADKGLAFIDFDSANLGDPGFDVGRFIAHLYKMKADWKIAPEVADMTVTNFSAAYNHTAAVPLSQERIDWFAASHLISSQVYKSVKRMDASPVNKLWKIAESLCPA